MFRNFGKMLATFVMWTVAAYVLVLFGTLAVWDLLGITDHDGGGAMGMAFIVAPSIALLAGVGGALWSTRRRLARKEDGEADVTPLSPAACALIGALVAYVPTRLAIFLFLGVNSYDSFWKAMAHAWTPELLAIAGAIVGWRRGRSREQR